MDVGKVEIQRDQGALLSRANIGQFSLLMSLNRPVPPPMAPVAHLLAMDRTTLTAALKPLERRDLVELQVDPADQRSRLIVLTNAGREALANAVPIWRATHQDVEAELLDPDTLRRELIALAYRPLNQSQP